jgi:hypothetical protein
MKEKLFILFKNFLCWLASLPAAYLLTLIVSAVIRHYFPFKSSCLEIAASITMLWAFVSFLPILSNNLIREDPDSPDRWYRM